MVMMAAKIPIFVDTNALIRLHVTTAPDHAVIAPALRTLVVQNHELWLSRQVLREYASVLTRPQVYAAPISGSDVAQQLRQFETMYRIADETPAVSQALYTLLDTIAIGGKQVHDANIVATMLTYGIGIVFTLNVGDFQRFQGLVKIIGPSDVIP